MTASIGPGKLYAKAPGSDEFQLIGNTAPMYAVVHETEGDITQWCTIDEANQVVHLPAGLPRGNVELNGTFLAHITKSGKQETSYDKMTAHQRKFIMRKLPYAIQLALDSMFNAPAPEGVTLEASNE